MRDYLILYHKIVRCLLGHGVFDTRLLSEVEVLVSDYLVFKVPIVQGKLSLPIGILKTLLCRVSKKVFIYWSEICS